MISDSELLREFAQLGSERALEAFLKRHMNTIYSVAMMRGNGDRDLAEEIAQQISITIARNAAQLTQHPSIVGWIYTSVRNAVIDVRRRQARERGRLEEIERHFATTETSEPPPPDKLHAFLLQELDRLDPSDRELLLLRFLQGKAHAQIAAMLLLPEETVRKRSARALLKLRRTLHQRGLKSGFSVLSATIAAATVPAPPAVLQGALAAALGASLPATAGFGLSVLSRKLILSALGTLVGAGALSLAFRFGRGPVSPGTPTEAPLPQTSVAPQAALPPVVSLTSGGTIAAGLDDVALLRSILAQRPEHYISEIEILADDDWKNVVRSFSPRIDAQVLPSLKALRDRGRARFGVLAADALNRYITGNGGRVPPDLLSLKPYFASAVADETLVRYAIIRPAMMDGAPADEPIVAEFKGLVDSQGDSVLVFGRTLSSIKIVSGDGLGIQVERAIARYMADNAGKKPSAADDLAGLLPDPVMLHARENWTALSSRIP